VGFKIWGFVSFWLLLLTNQNSKRTGGNSKKNGVELKKEQGGTQKKTPVPVSTWTPAPQRPALLTGSFRSPTSASHSRFVTPLVILMASSAAAAGASAVVGSGIGAPSVVFIRTCNACQVRLLPTGKWETNGNDCKRFEETTARTNPRSVARAFVVLDEQRHKR